MSQVTRSTCPYCGVGCGVLIHSERGAIVGVEGDPDHPANAGRLCTKGQTLHLTAQAALDGGRRLLTPQRRLHRASPLQAVSWDTAIATAVDRLDAIVAAYGPDAVGVYASGQLLTEDYYVFNQVVKGVLGTNHLDTNSRLCMSSAVSGYKATLGADAPPCSYEDLDHADTVFIAGSNTAWAHPVLFRRLEDARRRKPAQRWIVVDPRRTETAAQADLHLALLPGTDVALFQGLLHIMLWEGLIQPAYIEAHTLGFAAVRERVRECTPSHTARITGCAEADILQAARWFAAAPATLSLYCQGLNQSGQGTDKNIALIHLHLATGQIGRPGAGPFSLTGQPNAMGGREVGGLSTLLSAHRDLSNPEHRAEVARHWGVPDVPAKPGRTALEMFEAAAEGEVRALWIACTNPAQSLPQQRLVRRALERAELVIVQEAFADTATAAYADLLLPAATWGEKEGTVTNSERRISRVRAAIPPPGEARPDWQIAAAIGQGLADRWQRPAPCLTGLSPERLWNAHRDLTAGRDLDITGLSYSLLDAQGPQQWPFRPGDRQGAIRLYEDGHFAFADGRARFVDIQAQPVAEPRSAAYPFSLTTTRLRDQWHGTSRTGTLGRLHAHQPQPQLEMHPQDATRWGVRDGDWVHVQSRHGSVVLPILSTPSVAPTQLSVPMHWGSEVLVGGGGDGGPSLGINALLGPARCPKSHQPELKHVAVRLQPLRAPWELVARVALAPGTVLPTVRALRERLAVPALWEGVAGSVLPWGREETTGQPRRPGGVVLRLVAWGATPPPALLADLWALLQLEGAEVIQMTDARRGAYRRLRFDPTGRILQGYAVAGPASVAPVPEPHPVRQASQAWDRWVETGDAWEGSPRALLIPEAVPSAPRSPQVCACLDVRAEAIVAAAAQASGTVDERLAQVQASLGCGTQCGSCRPAVRSLVAEGVQ